jgi:hypothetical protein
MSGETFDAQGRAQQALRGAVSSYGPGVLSNPGVLNGLLPDSSRERNLVLTAAEAGVARELTKHVEQQRLEVGTAITMVAVALSSHRFIDIEGATWIATEYARALGYSVPGAAPSPAQANLAAYQPTATIDRSRLSPPGTPFPGGQPPGAQPRAPQPPGAQPPVPQPPGAQPPGAQPPGGQPPVAQPQVPQPPGVQPPQASPPAYQQPPSYQPQPGYQAPPGAQPGYQPPGGYQPQGGYPPGYQGSPSPVPPSPQWPGQPGGPPGGRRSRRGLLIGGIGGGVVVVVIAIIAILAASSPSPKPTPVASGTAVAPTQSVGLTVPPGPATTAPTGPASTTPATGPTSSLAPGATPVDQLLPSGINDTATQCQPVQQPLPFAAPGLVTAIRCADPNLPKGTVFGFQSDSTAHYQTTWQNYNKWLGFDAATAGSNCPPTGSNPQGVTEWKPDSQPSYSKRQVLECGTLGKGAASQPVYIWSFPKDDAFLVAQASHATTFKTLDTWWTNN